MVPVRIAVRFSLLALTVGLAILAFQLQKVPVNVGHPMWWRWYFLGSALACGIATLRPVRGWTIPIAGGLSVVAFLSRAAADLVSRDHLPRWIQGTTIWSLLAVLTWCVTFAIATHLPRDDGPT